MGNRISFFNQLVKNNRKTYEDTIEITIGNDVPGCLVDYP